MPRDDSLSRSPIRMDPAGQAIVDALTRSLGGQISDISADLSSFRNHVEKRFTDINDKMMVHDAKFAEAERRMNEIERQARSGGSACSGGSNASTAAGGSSYSTNPYSTASSSGSDLDNQYSLVPARRRVLALGGFPRDTDGQDIQTYITNHVLPHHSSLFDGHPKGRLTSTARLICRTPDDMWKFLKSMKGKRLSFTDSSGIAHELWHGIDKSASEQLRSRRVSHLVKAIRVHCVEKLIFSVDDAAKKIDGDYFVGFIWVQINGDVPGSKRNIRLFERLFKQETFKVTDSAGEANMQGLDLATLCNEANAIMPRNSE